MDFVREVVPLATLIGGGIGAFIKFLFDKRKGDIDQIGAIAKGAETVTLASKEYVDMTKAEFREIKERLAATERDMEDLRRQTRRSQELVESFVYWATHITDNWTELRERKEPPCWSDDIMHAIRRAKGRRT